MRLNPNQNQDNHIFNLINRQNNIRNAFRENNNNNNNNEEEETENNVEAERGWFRRIFNYQNILNFFRENGFQLLIGLIFTGIMVFLGNINFIWFLGIIIFCRL